MKARLKSVLAGASALAVTGAILVSGATSASAAVTPGWEPDANTIGGVYLYNAAGQQITSGNTTDSPLAAYYVTSGAPLGGANKPYQAFSTPVAGQNSATWAGTQQVSSAQSQPQAGLPGDLAGVTAVNVVKGAATDGSLQSVQIAAFPNSSAVSGYAGLYEIRVYPSATASTWYSAVIQVSGTTWTQIWPVQTTTTTTLATSASTVVNPGSATLTATVSPASAGNVVFTEGATVIATVAVAGGTAATTINYTALGSHTYGARFVPTPGSANLGSTSNTVGVTVVAPADNTATALSVTPASGAGFSAQTLVATVTDTTTPATTPVGSVAFYDNGSSVALAGTVTQSPAGTFTLVTSALGQGAHSIVAKFTATNPSLFNASQSQPTGFTLTAPLCADGTTNCIDTQNITATVQAGTITLTTPYTAANPFNVGTLAVNSAGTLIVGSATFPATADAPLTITDTRAGNVGWTATVYDSALTSTATAGPGQYNVINGENVGLTNWVATVPVGNAYPASQIVTTNLPAAAGLAPTTHGAGSGAGIWGGGTPATASTFATNVHGDGTAQLRATLTIQAPTSTVAGVYNGTITFTVA